MAWLMSYSLMMLFEDFALALSACSTEAAHAEAGPAFPRD